MASKTSAQGWDNFGLSCLCVLAFPLLPLIFELVFFRAIKPDSWFLAAAMYIIGVGLTSKWKSYFFATVIASFLATAVYGYSLTAPDKGLSLLSIAERLIAAAMFVHLVERFYRHIIVREPFFEWEK